MDTLQFDRALSFTPLNQAHLPLLHEWFQDPVVKKWYAGDKARSLDDISKKYLPRIEGKDKTVCFIVSVSGEPVGFIQYYALCNNFPDGVSSQNNAIFKMGAADKIGGIDLFIAYSEHRKKGLGAALINQFVSEHLVGVFDVVVVDPLSDNLLAIHCYEKCGFQRTDYSESDLNVIMKRELKP